MAIHLGQNCYGESRVRLLRVARQEGRHDIRELSISIRFAQSSAQPAVRTAAARSHRYVLETGANQ